MFNSVASTSELITSLSGEDYHPVVFLREDGTISSRTRSEFSLWLPQGTYRVIGEQTSVFMRVFISMKFAVAITAEFDDGTEKEYALQDITDKKIIKFTLESSAIVRLTLTTENYSVPFNVCVLRLPSKDRDIISPRLPSITSDRFRQVQLNQQLTLSRITSPMTTNAITIGDVNVRSVKDVMDMLHGEEKYRKGLDFMAVALATDKCTVLTEPRPTKLFADESHVTAFVNEMTEPRSVSLEGKRLHTFRSFIVDTDVEGHLLIARDKTKWLDLYCVMSQYYMFVLMCNPRCKPTEDITVDREVYSVLDENLACERWEILHIVRQLRGFLTALDNSSNQI